MITLEQINRFAPAVNERFSRLTDDEVIDFEIKTREWYVKQIPLWGRPPSLRMDRLTKRLEDEMPPKLVASMNAKIRTSNKTFSGFFYTGESTGAGSMAWFEAWAAAEDYILGRLFEHELSPVEYRVLTERWEMLL